MHGRIIALDRALEVRESALLVDLGRRHNAHVVSVYSDLGRRSAAALERREHWPHPPSCEWLYSQANCGMGGPLAPNY